MVFSFGLEGRHRPLCDFTMVGGRGWRDQRLLYVELGAHRFAGGCAAEAG